MHILLVEDNPGDVLLVTEALEVAGIDARLEVADNGERALTVLDRKAAQNALPDLVILDLNLPIRNGREVLAAMRATDAIRRLPVAILSSSRHDGDVCRDYSPACRYFVKPTEFSDLVQTVKNIHSFWQTSAAS